MTRRLLKRKKVASDQWIIENIDHAFLEQQVSIALEAYERQNLPHGTPLDNFLGIMGEYAFEGFLEDTCLLVKERDYKWNERKLDYWEKDPRPWDFLIRDKLAFELGSVRPYHNYAMLKACDHKERSDFFVQIQVNWLRCCAKVFWHGKRRWFMLNAHDQSEKPKEITDKGDIADLERGKGKFEDQENIGLAVIKGWDGVKKVLKEDNGWEFKKAGNVLTPYADAYVKYLSDLEPVRDLEEIIAGGKAQAMKRPDEQGSSKGIDEWTG